MSVGVIAFPVTLGITPRHIILIIDFLIIKVPSTYNKILGQPCIKMAKAILSTYHLMMKFPIKVCIGEVIGNLLIAKECYITVISGKQNAMRYSLRVRIA